MHTSLEPIARYYSAKLAEHGETPRGVDWNGEESQTTRFAQLAKVIDQPSPFSINDVGCGYGAFLTYIGDQYRDVEYRGVDISSAMIDAARRRNPGNAIFVESLEQAGPADYTIASGIFNVRLSAQIDAWTLMIHETLDEMNAYSHRGFAFNCLTAYSDPERMREDLFYGDPCVLFDLCKRRYSRNVALLHDYGLYEFTIIVRKP